MTKLLEHRNIGFEVLNLNEESVTYKRVINRNIPDKQKKKIEMQLPKLTVHFFEPEDLEHLRRISLELSEEIERQKRSISLKEKLLNYLMKF